MDNVEGSIRKVAKFVYILFFILIAQLTYLQVVDAKNLENNPKNTRTILNKFTKPRGDIITADNVIVATSTPSDDEWKFQRQYPLGELFGHITGFQSFRFGNTGVENTYNKDLQGERGKKENVPRVFLSVNSDIQKLLKEKLGNEKGSIVVMEAKTGSIVGMYSNPSYDPNPLASHDQYGAQESFTNLNNDPLKPSLSRAFGERYAPGSTFKIVTAAAALETGKADDDYDFGALNYYDLPDSDKNIVNFSGACGGTLQHAFQQSCNVVFASLGVEMADDFTTQMEKFGVGGKFDGNQNVGPAPKLDIEGAVGATGTVENSFKNNKPSFAYAGIGQQLVALSPLSVAMMTSAIANKGTIPTPHVVDHTEDGSGTVLRRINPGPFKENVVTPEIAEKVTGYMIDVVNQGTGTRAKIKNLQIAGKTGTAQVDCPSGVKKCSPNAWFTSFAPADSPQYIVTVFLETSASTNLDATGGQLSAPIAKSIYEKLFNLN